MCVGGGRSGGNGGGVGRKKRVRHYQQLLAVHTGTSLFGCMCLSTHDVIHITIYTELSDELLLHGILCSCYYNH